MRSTLDTCEGTCEPRSRCVLPSMRVVASGVPCSAKKKPTWEETFPKQNGRCVRRRTMKETIEMKRPVERVQVLVGQENQILREGSGGRVVYVLPQVWAVAEPAKREPVQGSREEVRKAERVPSNSDVGVEAQTGVEVAFYRKYTEAMVRRYGVLSMEAGRVPSLIGKEMFRGRVTNYRVQGFDDVVIFCHDMESCLKKLDQSKQDLIKRITLQEYTLGEAANILGLSLRNCVRQYAHAVDSLTRLLLKARLLEPLSLCQEG